MIPHKIYVWSSGTESWYLTDMPADEFLKMKLLHEKNFGSGRLFIYKDTTHRYFGMFWEKV
jgi:hypothetical protein